MCERWMRPLQLEVSPDQLQLLPRNSAFRYDYREGKVWINPRPSFHHARLDLGRYSPGPDLDDLALRPLDETGWEPLGHLFSAAFHQVQPFAALQGVEHLEAARACLMQTRLGGDGPVISPACWIAMRPSRSRLVGAALVTLLPLGDLMSLDSYYWPEPPPLDAVERRLGRPHLTWIFVSPLEAGRGVGTRLLDEVVARLLALGFTELVSTFMKGNDPSVLWHWRNGFELLTHPTSKRHPGLAGP